MHGYKVCINVQLLYLYPMCQIQLNSNVRVIVLEVTVHVERQFTTYQSMLTHHIAGGPSMHMY